jgi:hypothetical protein
MKHIYILLFISLFVGVTSQQVNAQTNEEFSVNFREEDDRRRLLEAEAAYKERSDIANDTQRELNAAKAALDEAQARYNEAKRRHKDASNAAKHAKKSYRMEQKAQKAAKKADKQADKARSASFRME